MSNHLSHVPCLLREANSQRVALVEHSQYGKRFWMCFCTRSNYRWYQCELFMTHKIVTIFKHQYLSILLIIRAVKCKSFEIFEDYVRRRHYSTDYYTLEQWRINARQWIFLLAQGTVKTMRHDAHSERHKKNWYENNWMWSKQKNVRGKKKRSADRNGSSVSIWQHSQSNVHAICLGCY